MTFNALQLPGTSADMEISYASTTVKRPNRRHFETVLANLNNSIKQKDAECVSILGKRNRDSASNQNDIGQLFRLKNEIFRSKTEREAIRSLRVPQLSAKVDDLQKQIKTIKEKISKIEYDHLSLKDEQKLRAILKNLDDRYMNSQSKNLRDENWLVSEINKYKRNLNWLPKWRSLIATKDDLIKSFNEAKNERHRLYKHNQALKSDLNSLHIEERNCRQRGYELSRELDQLHAQKKSLVTNYEQERKDYIQWSQHNKKPRSQQRQVDHNYVGKQVKRTSSWKNPRHNANDDNSSDSDGDDYEAFAKEKQICRSLMNYLQNFMTEQQKLSVVNATESHDVDKRHHVSDAQSVVSLKKDESDEEGHQLSASPKQSVKRHTKKDKRKTTQAIPLEPHVISEFESVGITAPVNYIEVPIAFEKLQERLMFYEEQTSLTLNFSYSYDEFAYASSESEMTADSARFSVMTLSEADDSLSSQTGQNLSQSSSFEKHSTSARNRNSFDVESPKLAFSPIKTKQKCSLSRSLSCDASIGQFKNETRPIKEAFSIVKKKFFSLQRLSLTKIIKGSTCDEGIEVFLSKDSSANSNTIRF